MLRWIELDLDYDKQQLLQIFKDNQNHLKTYINKNGDNQPIGILKFPNKPDYILKMESRFNFVHDSYFILSSGYHPHRDDTRQCIISFEVQNENNIPLKFYYPEEEVFHKSAIMWNTKCFHGSDPSPTERIFYQIELLDSNKFEYYVNKHKDNELLNENSISTWR